MKILLSESFNFFNRKGNKKQVARAKDKNPKQNRTADNLPFHTINRRCKEIIQKTDETETQRNAAFMILVMNNTGLRYSDAVLIKHLHLKTGYYKFKTQKTGVNNLVYFNDRVTNAYWLLINQTRPHPDSFVFINRNGNKINLYTVNRVLKFMFVDENSRGKNISTQSLRKSFARQIIDISENTFTGFKDAQNAFAHVNLNNTLNYLYTKEITPKAKERKRIFELRNRKRKQNNK